MKQLIYAIEGKSEIFINVNRIKYKFVMLYLKIASFKKPFLSQFPRKSIKSCNSHK